MAHVRQVKPHDAARTVDVLRVIHDEVRVKRQFHLTSRVLRKHCAFVRSTARVAVPEEIPLARRDSYLPVVTSELIAEVGCETVLSVCSAHILAVQQCKAVLDGIGAVGISAALECIEIVIVTRSAVCRRHTLRQRLDVLVDAVLVVDALTPVAHHLLIEHLQHILQRHRASQLVCHLPQFVRAASHKFPQHGVVSCKRIRADALVHRLPRDRVVVFQNRVVALTEHRVHVVWDEIPYLAVPRHEHHVLRAVVHSHEVVRYQIPCKWRVVAEVFRIFVQEFRRVALARVYPLPKALHCRLVVLMRRRPCVVGLEAELQSVVKRVHVARTEQTQCLRVVQELQADTLVAPALQCSLVIEALDTLKAVDDAAAALLVVEVVLAKIHVLTRAVVVVEQIYRETVHADSHIIVALVGHLWRSQPAASLPDVVHHSHRTRIMRR